MKKYVAFIFIPILLSKILFLPSSVYAQDTQTPIMGHGKLSSEEMSEYLFSNNDQSGINPISKEYADNFAILTIKYSSEEGVDHDVAFALMMHETGYLNFGGDVLPSQNNFGGLGAVGGGANGASFATVDDGILAVVQHLKCYASNEPLNLPCVDPRFNEQLRKKAVYVEELGYEDNPNGTGWAYPGSGYGKSITSLISIIPTSVKATAPTTATSQANEQNTPQSTQNKNDIFAISNANVSDISVVVLTLVLIILIKLFVSNPKGKNSRIKQIKKQKKNSSI